MKEHHNFDTTVAENFADFLLDTLNKGALSFMISIGHRSGLFDTMETRGFFHWRRLPVKQN